MQNNHLEVSLSALKHNAHLLRNYLTHPNDFYSVVKSNAYGMGVDPVVSALLDEKFNHVCVSDVEEASALQKFSKKDLQILILNPLYKEEIPLVAQHSHWVPSVSSFEELNQLSKYPFDRVLSVHIKINLGLSRFGFSPEDIEKITQQFKTCSQLGLTGMYSHLSNGSNGGIPNSSTQKQVQHFGMLVSSIRKEFPDVKAHIFNSSGLLSYISHQQKAKWGARIGGSLYGVKHKIPYHNQKACEEWSQLNLKPVCTLKSKIVSFRLLKKGEAVSYGSLWVADKKSTIAVVAMGYYHGLIQTTPSSVISVLFRGHRVPIVGAICMNHFIIDITSVVGIDCPTVGEEVVIYGEQKSNLIRVEEFANNTRREPYEVMTSIGHTVHRVYKD